MQCLNAMTKYVSLESFEEVSELCEKAVNAIAVNIEAGKVMKVRWNACYVSHHLFVSSCIFDRASEE